MKGRFSSVRIGVLYGEELQKGKSRRGTALKELVELNRGAMEALALGRGRGPRSMVSGPACTYKVSQLHLRCICHVASGNRTRLHK